ncbi:hypothetical protein J5Y04_26070 [Kitasatospora sp. RG8]|uniref:HNH endonuclease n=1 Tax=Kitasatospora sp. RG8 TaxID=2820815 RepID=UPI001ADFEAD5|nr:HNH endonuclease [Kitasatospora sp. RG8]MBP0452986.1 hypothetical protein [Kitasatospora sp. RG8]
MNKRERWFNEGAPHLRRTLEAVGLGKLLPDGDFYMCPCCLIAYPRGALLDETLTEEHVPPRGLGGRGMLLTCKGCNNKAGHYFDSHAIKRLKVLEFIMGRGASRTLRATFHADGVPLRGEVTRAGSGILMQGVPKQNDSRVVEDHERALMRSRGFQFTITEQFTARLADISWVRSAYLAAFSAFGYRYIFQPALDPIRAQLKDPDAEILPSLVGFNPDAPASGRSVNLVRSPDDLQGVLVIMGHYSVMLPDPWGTLSCQELAAAIGRRTDSEGRLEIMCDGQIAPWPQSPAYRLDLEAE